MSGFLGQIFDSLNREGGQSPIISVIQRALEANGGIGGLINRFQQAGLGDRAQSWVSTGPNQSITPQNVEQVFGPEEIAHWANQVGIQPDQMRAVLAEALPRAVDHFTPNGEVPAQTPDLGSLISRFLGR